MEAIQQSILLSTSYPPLSAFQKFETMDPRIELKKFGDRFIPHHSDHMIKKGTIKRWIVTSIGVVSTPLLLLTILIHSLYQRIKYGYSFKEYYGMSIILGAFEIDRKAADKKRAYIQRLSEDMQPDFLKKLAEVTSNSTTKKNIEDSATLHLVEIPLPGKKSKLDALSIERIDVSRTPPADQKWIVYYPGRRMCYEQWHQYAIMVAKETGASVLMPNFRGIMRSGRENLDDPKSSQEHSFTAKHLAEDARAVTTYLEDKGIKKNNILNYGYSMGAAAASTQLDMAICADRCFSSLDAMTRALLYAPLLRHLFAWIASSCWGDIDVYANTRKIQDNGKDVFICATRQDFWMDIKYSSLYAKFLECAPEKTPTSLFLSHTDPNGFFARLRHRILIHSASPVTELKNLLSKWTDN